MMSIGTFVLIWPFFMIGLAVVAVLVVHAILDRASSKRS
jgi:hypothetical protein